MTFDPAEHGWTKLDNMGFGGLVGPFWAKDEAEGRALGILTDSRHANRAGMIHGGMLMTMMDHALGYMSWHESGRNGCVTMQLDTHFVSAGTPGDFLEARGHIIRSAKSVVFVRGEITVGDKIIMSANGIWKILPARPPKA